MSSLSLLINSLQGGYPPPPCISYANVRNYYGPYAHCSLAIEQWKVQQ